MCSPGKNKRVARHRLKQRRQRSGESFDHFTKDLRIILMDCDYRDPDDILVDYIIDASHDKRVQEKFYDSGEELSLAKAIEIGQQLELSQK